MKTSNNIKIINNLLISEGDKSTSQFEVVQQKGGNSYCFLYASNAENAGSYIETHCKYVETITDRIETIKKNWPFYK